MSELRTIDTPNLEYQKLYYPAQEANVVPVFTAEVDRFAQYGAAALGMWGYADKWAMRGLEQSNGGREMYVDCDNDSVIMDTRGTSIRLRTVTSTSGLNFKTIRSTETTRAILPVLVVDAANLASDGLAAVRMQGYASRMAVGRMLQTNELTLWSRGRDSLWIKGATSGGALKTLGVYTSAAANWLLVDVDPDNRPTCHTGRNSCFELETVGE